MSSAVELGKDFLLSESTKVPFYYQIKQYFKKKIESKEWLPGQRLPYESEICSRFDVSRIVVRQAYQELKSEGYIISKKGKGSYIVEPKIYTNWVQNLMGFSISMTKLGYKVKNTVLNQEKVVASEEVAKNLHLKDDLDVILVKRVHNINGDPFYISTNYLPYSLFPELINDDLTGSLYNILITKYTADIIHSKRFIEGGKASGEEVKYLNIEKDDFIFKVESIGYLKGDIPFEYFNSIHIGEKTKFVIELIKSDFLKYHSTELIDELSTGIDMSPYEFNIVH